MMCNICLISNNEIFREGLSHILKADSFSVIGSFSDISCVKDWTPPSGFMAVIDCLDPEDQIEAIEHLKSQYPSAIVVVIAERFDVEGMVNCFKSGAQGYITKSMKALPLITALRLVALGETVFPSDLVEVLGRNQFHTASVAEIEHDIERVKLSPRELDVLCCVMAGYSNKLIARHLDVCEATVKVHVKAILRKLQVNNRTQAAIWANSHGIFEANLAA